MTDILTTNPDWESYLADQQQLGDDMKAAHTAMLDNIMRTGRIPNWIEPDELVQKDERRLMSLIEEHVGYVMGDPVTVSLGTVCEGLFPVSVTRHVDSLTHDAGFESAGNCKATVNRCLAKGWIARQMDEVTGRLRYDLTERGRWVMDIVENDEWFEKEE